MACAVPKKSRNLKPTEHNDMKNKNLLFVGTIITTIFILIFFTHNGRGPILGSLDIAIFRAINSNMQNPIFNNLGAIAEKIGGSNLRMLILFIAFVMVIGLIIQNTRNLKKLVMVLIIALLVSNFISYPLKVTFGVSRPYFYLNEVHTNSAGKWHSYEKPLSDGDKKNSFPSGHALITFPLLGVLWPYKKLRIPLSIFLLIEGFLLVYTGSHYFSDVIAGGTLGFIIGHLTQIKFNAILY
jgi:membrane-associated phospholipid phosphatase